MSLGLTVVQQQLEYSSLWLLDISHYFICKIQCNQNALALIVVNRPSFAVYLELTYSFHWLPFHSYIISFRLCFSAHSCYSPSASIFLHRPLTHKVGPCIPLVLVVSFAEKLVLLLVFTLSILLPQKS